LISLHPATALVLAKNRQKNARLRGHFFVKAEANYFFIGAFLPRFLAIFFAMMMSLD
jgi:hypothetical protein